MLRLLTASQKPHSFGLRQPRRLKAEQGSATGSPKWLRHPNIARQCIHLDPHRLTNEEAKGMTELALKLDTSCRSCTGHTLLQRCHGGSGVDGFTTVAWCANKCTVHVGTAGIP